MGKYTNIKSNFLKEKIKNINWKNKDEREKIDGLIFVENIILGKERLSWASSFKWNALKNTKELKTIYRELKPEEFAQIKKDEVKEAAEEKRKESKLEEEERLEEERDRKDWVKAGGNL
ncbi:hypothetical protein J4456_05290 [Candidatus Pacearchaeota archaeon]|nr:hypothetical protein [Candidatus Pacearchaeota archaeon]